MLAAGACALATASGARADVKPIPVKSVSPADGATITQADSITLEVKTDDVASMARIEIATQPNLGQDGTLAAEFTLPGFGFVLVTRGDAFPDTYTATATRATSSRRSRARSRGSTRGA